MQKLITTKKSKICFGMQNIAYGGYYLPFFDYDLNHYDKIEKDLLFLQKKYKLSDIFIFDSIHGYNAFSLDKLPYNIFKDLCNDSKYICEDYRTLGLKRGVLTLRVGTDKILKYILFKTGNWKKSLAHYIALQLFYDVNILYDNEEFDNNYVLKMKAYRSEKHGFIEIEEL